MKTYIGIDNGVSGAVGIIHPDFTQWSAMPVRSEQNYTKAKKNITRVDWIGLKFILGIDGIGNDVLAVIERPMVNPGRFQATISAVRCLEATLIVLEELVIPYLYIDSKKWQKTQLPSGLVKEELKKASLDIGRRLWPSIAFKPDADAMLIARHAQQSNL